MLHSVCNAAPPPNDNFANRIILTGTSGTDTRDLSDATLEPGEPFHYPAGFSSNSAWWVWTAPHHGACELNTSGSAVETIIAVYTGDTIDTLTRVALGYIDNMYFNAIGGMNYQVAIITPRGVPGNWITVHHRMITVSDWYIHKITTNTSFFVIPTHKGDMLYEKYTDFRITSYRTNQYGVNISRITEYKYNSHGISVYDKHAQPIINTVQLFPPGTAYHVEDFNGKEILVYNQDTSTLILYRLGNKGITKINERILPDTWVAFLSRSGIYSLQFSDDLIRDEPLSGIRVFNKSLSRETWGLTVDYGSIGNLFASGVCTRETADPYSYIIHMYKKGEEATSRELDYRMSAYPYYDIDRKMNMLYWYYHGTWPYFTNSPLTYIDNKGEIIFENQVLAGAGLVWELGDYDGKDLYVIQPAGTAHTIHKYRIRKTIKKKGETSINNIDYFNVFNRKPTAMQRLGDLEGFTQFNSNLSKTTWIEPIAPGNVYYIGYGAFVRETITPLGGSSNFTYRIFNRKKTIAEHTITY